MAFGALSYIPLVCRVLVVFFFALAEAANEDKKVQKASYAPGDAIPVSCLNRTIETGEHITDDEGQLQYIPFWTCNETSRPLEVYFGVEKGPPAQPHAHIIIQRLTLADINCTLNEVDDSLFHLLEFYIHNDAPLTCRIPTHPLTSIKPTTTNDDFIPLIFALSGALQLSHLHISPKLNVLLHTSPELATQDADILAATAYSSPSLPSASTRIVIGDPLAFQLSVHWYTTPTLPPSTTGKQGLGGHVHFSTVVYCLLSAGVGVAGSLAYFRGVELPRRLRGYGKDRMGGERGGGYAFPGTGMNGYGTGKRD